MQLPKTHSTVRAAISEKGEGTVVCLNCGSIREHVPEIRPLTGHVVRVVHGFVIQR